MENSISNNDANPEVSGSELNNLIDLYQRGLCKLTGATLVVIASSEGITKENLSFLSTHTNSKVRRAVAGNPKTPVDALVRLASDKTAAVRDAVVEHPAFPEEQAMLARRMASATPETIAYTNDAELLTVASIRTRDFRAAAARNSHTPKDVLKKLLDDSVSDVVDAARYNPATPIDALVQSINNERHRFLKIRYLGQHKLRRSVIYALLKDGDAESKRLIADRRDLELNILEKLASDRNFDVRSHIACKHNLPDSIASKLASDPDSEIREMIADRKDLSPAIVVTLSSDDEALVRGRIARRLNLGPEIIAKLATDPDARVRITIANNPLTPARILVSLSKDDNQDVLAAVAGNLRTPVITLAKLAIYGGEAGMQAYTNPSFEEHSDNAWALSQWADRAIDFSTDQFIPNNDIDDEDADDALVDSCIGAVWHCNCYECFRYYW